MISGRCAEIGGFPNPDAGVVDFRPGSFEGGEMGNFDALREMSPRSLASKLWMGVTAESFSQSGHEKQKSLRGAVQSKECSLTGGFADR